MVFEISKKDMMASAEEHYNIGKAKVEMAQFKRSLSKSFEKLDKATGMFGIRRIWIPIGELHKDMKLSKEQFSKELTILLKVDDKQKISLAGGPSHVYKTFENFEFEGKRYLYLHIKYDNKDL